MNYLKLYFSCCLFLFYFCCSFGQVKLSGLVIGEDKNAIPYATVILTNKNDSDSFKGTTTNEKGYFEFIISKKGTYDITISFIGFENNSKVIDLQESIELGRIILKRSEILLDEIKIIHKKRIIENKNGTLVFNVDKSPMKTGYDGMELLRNSPNVFIGVNNEILMRNEEVTLMINGVVSNLSGADLMNYLSSLQSENIKSITFKSHLSANIDGESSGGVINLILKKIQKGYSTSLRSNYTFKESNYYDFSGRAIINYGTKNWNVYGNYNLSKSTSLSDVNRDYDYLDGGNLNKTKVTHEGLGRKQYNYLVGFVLNASEKDVFDIAFYDLDMFNPYKEYGSIQILNNNSIEEDGDLFFDYENKEKLKNTNFNYIRIIDSLYSKITVSSTYLTQDLITDNSLSSIYNQGVYENSKSTNITTARTKVFSSQADLEKNTIHQLTIKSGVKYVVTERLNNLFSSASNTVGIDSENNYSFKYKEQIFASYVSLDKTIANFLVEVGLRYENTTINSKDLLVNATSVTQEYSSFFTAVYLSYKLKNNQSLSFGYSKKIKRPYFNNINNYITKINDFSYSIGNPNLQSENVYKYEVGFHQKEQTISLYYTNVTNAIVSYYYTEDDIVYHQYTNGGKNFEFGVAYNYTNNVFPWWYMNGNATFFRRKFVNEEKQEILDWTTSGSFKWTNIFKINKTTSVDLSGYYTSPYIYDYNKQYGYNSVDVVFKKAFFNNKLQSKVYFNDVFNILFYKNETNLNDVTRFYSNKPLTQFIQISFTYNLSNLNFKKKNTLKNDIIKRL